MTARGSYAPEMFELLAASDRRHFWYEARNAVIGAAVRRALGERRCGRVLEVGCGQGAVLPELRRACPGAAVVGLDRFMEALALARRRFDSHLVRADLLRAPFGPSFDLVGMFDVLEHLDDDAGALSAVRRLLCPGGLLVVTVPAGPSLWSRFDEAAGHCRRYRGRELRQRLEDAGLRVEYVSCFMTLPTPLVWLSRSVNALKDRVFGAPSDAAAVQRELAPSAPVNRALAALVSWEPAAVGRGVRLPFGTSLVAVGRAPLPEDAR